MANIAVRPEAKPQDDQAPRAQPRRDVSAPHRREDGARRGRRQGRRTPATLVKKAVAIIDSAVTKGILKRQTASRYVSRLATRTPA